MSEWIFDVDGTALNRFYGGSARGVCYQVTDDAGRFVQLTSAQMRSFLECCAERHIASASIAAVRARESGR